MRLHPSLLFLAFACATPWFPSAARAQVDLAWHDCITQPGAALNASYACDGIDQGFPLRLVASFVSPAQFDHFVGVQVKFNVHTSDPQVPDWWRMGVGECRENALTFPGSLSGIGTGTTGACRNPWIGPNGSTGGGYQWVSNEVFAGRYGFSYPAQGYGALTFVFARDTETSLESGQRYVAGVLEFEPRPLTSEEEPCAGCPLPACIGLFQVEIFQTVGSPGGDIVVLQEEGIRNYVTWQGGSIGGDGCPRTVPTRRATWGAIKAIYR